MPCYHPVELLDLKAGCLLCHAETVAHSATELLQLAVHNSQQCWHDQFAELCRFEGKVPAVHAEKGAQAAAELGQQVGPIVADYVACLEARKIKEGIRKVMEISSVGQAPCQPTKQFLLCPWGQQGTHRLSKHIAEP